MLEHYIIKEGKRLRCGFTTGSAALAAVKGCLEMLCTDSRVDVVQIETKAGIDLDIELVNQEWNQHSATCGVIKDAGDDPDVTHGIEIVATVTRLDDKDVILDGGEGVGRITRKGLFGEIGEAAINPVPAKMIRELLESYGGGFQAVISVPKGREIAKKTFNAQLGIEGGISIIGTKGIVYPMSDESLIKTIYMEMDMLKDQVDRPLLLTPGNYGEQFMRDRGIEIHSIKVSNFFGDALLYAESLGFRRLVLLGHIGKFSKLSIGIYNTHSHVADSRLEAFTYYLAHEGAPLEVIRVVEDSLTAEEAVERCFECGYAHIFEKMKNGIQKRVKAYMKNEEMEIQVILYSMKRGEL